MKRFSRLYRELDATTRTNDKVAALVEYFRDVPPEDAAWALYVLTGNKIPRVVTSRQLREWLTTASELPEWLIDECYDTVGDLSETIALLLPRPDTALDVPLTALIEERILPLKRMEPAAQEALVRKTWNELAADERYLFHKLILGNFRVGVARTLVARALAQVADVPPEIMAHRLMGQWRPTVDDYATLLSGDSAADPGRPYPFFLASALEVEPETLGPVSEWRVEWKWDGIRAQVIRRAGQTLVWSRGEELVTDRYPEAHAVGDALPEGTVLDGELLAWRGSSPLPFGVLQRRIGRKSVGPRLLTDAPVAFVAYDVLEHDGVDVRELALDERRVLLERLVADVQAAHAETALKVSERLAPNDWDDVTRFRDAARDRLCEGVMLKRAASPYGVGRTRGDWWKWKSVALTIDAVLVYAQQGHGRRAGLFTDYTFAVWDGDDLVPVAKAYSGLTDAEIRDVDRYVRANTLNRFGPVSTVKAELVFELNFEGIQISSRHKSGLAVRFPRIARQRPDKPAREADTLESLRRMAEAQARAPEPHDRPESPPISPRGKRRVEHPDQLRLFD